MGTDTFTAEAPLTAPASVPTLPVEPRAPHLSIVRAPGVELAMALSKAQGAMTNIGKDRDVEVKSEKGRYSFKYATLAAMWNVIRKPLSDNGLAVVQLPTIKLKSATEGSVDVETRILHVSGESLVGHFELPTSKRDPQGLGGVVSYAKRYALAAMLGLAQEDETDVDDAEGGRFAGLEAPPPQSPTSTVPKTSSGPAPSVVDLGLALRDAKTQGELKSAAAAVAAAKGRGLTQQQHQDLLNLWKARKAELDAALDKSPRDAAATTKSEPGAEG